MSHFKRPASRLRRPFLLGLTGSIGMGKSTAAKMFEAEGIPVFDADAEVHRLQGPGGALVAAIEARFPGTTGPKGVDRHKLGAQVLGNTHELAALEAIVHPAVGRAQKRFLARHRARAVVILDIPLLFEKGGWRRVGAIAVVSAPAWMQRKRVMRRPGMTLAKLRAVRRLQVPDRVKRARADFIIETGRPKSATHRQIRAIASCFRAR
ncbi:MULTISPECIES: dephospho-CoA kinase [unclassified Sphingopyxis]|uniref:dephospho-CoA kinase n=1 Tax=unclassified Sphingopyxis TaxID=2614943 RepID=UPI00073699A6|nr:MULTISPECIES: dephospho-CoA kinase [unclassified Sphingopyxis]KTE45722.1 dephospho-CoA kinase [Sphingopyxis sp. HIX]KTE85600.1 dephospho-CoA kinase [Sphingopyxis sp. HXXIV]